MSETKHNDDLRDLYQDLILDHGKHPRNFRTMPEANREVMGHNPLCGDKLTLMLHVDENDVIRDAAFQGSGCAISMASASMMTDMLKGKTAAEAQKLFDYFLDLCTGGNEEDRKKTASAAKDAQIRLEALSGVRHYPVRVKCALLPWRALESALSSDGAKNVKTE
jgi:nitrogen fixation protein NifU and related proteins